MKKLTIVLSICFCFLFPFHVNASEKITLYLFHGSTCPHCKEAREYLNEIQNQYPEMEVVGYEVFEDEKNNQLLTEVRKILGSDSRGVPFFVIGERYLTGFGDYRKQDLIDALDYYREHKSEYQDVVLKVVNGELKKEDDSFLEEVHPVSLNEVRKNKDIIHIIGCGVIIILLAIIYCLLGKREKNRM